jgi:hypothetical protein
MPAPQCKTCRVCGAPLNMDGSAAARIRVGCTSFISANPCTKCGLLHEDGEGLLESRAEEGKYAHLRDGKIEDLPLANEPRDLSEVTPN